MKVIKETKCKMIASGYHGTYYRINKHKGIKVFDFYTDAQSELRGLRKANKVLPYNTPKAYGIVKFINRHGNKQYGVVMKHLKGKVVGNCNHKVYSKYEKLQDKMEKLNLYHEDFHDENAIAVKTKRGHKIYAIDWCDL